MQESSDLVIVDFADIAEVIKENDHNFVGGVMFKKLERAFGSSNDSLGVLAIRNVPGFCEAKKSFLPMAHKLAHLPSSYLGTVLTDEQSLYNAGWSHGKEKLRTDKPDMAKGSFYFNPITDTPGTESERVQYPASYPCNVWPDESVLPGFRDAARHLGVLMHSVVVQFAKVIDAYMAALWIQRESDGSERSAASGGNEAYPKDFLYDAMYRTEKVKGRLLYYFPLRDDDDRDDDGNMDDKEDDSWIGWHYDSGFITALAGEMYVDDNTGISIRSCPDPKAGLYVMNRKGGKIKVDIPDNCMGVQIGECVQIVTGGALVATPHCVRGVTRSEDKMNSRLSVARISFPCFVDTVPDFPLRVPFGCSRFDVIESGVGDEKVPPLALRWTEDGMKFGDFLQRTFATYYEWPSLRHGEEEEANK